MESITKLFKTPNHKIYNYPVAGATRMLYRGNNGNPFYVHCVDGKIRKAYGFGEKQFTFDHAELIQAKKDYQNRRAWLKVHNELIAKLNELDNETLEKIVKNFCEKG